MIKHLQLKKVLATLLTIAAVFAGQQAFATITDFMSIRGQSANINGQYYYVWSISGFMGQFSQPMTQGNSYTFNGQNIGLNRGDVHITGTLNFAESNELTDVTTGSLVTIVFSSDQFWFYGATVKKLDGTNVTGCSASASSDHTSITVTIPSGKTFGNIYLDFVAYEPFYNYNTTISGVESTYIYTGRPIEPVPTVTYNGRTLTAGTDYTVSYSNTTGPGSASVTVTGTGQYAGTVTRNYNIRAVALTDFNSLGSNTYAIATTADLDHLAAYVNLGNECQGLTFKQTADIAYTYTTTWNSSTSGETNFTAIGGWGRPFKGTFDGQNHSISGIRISKNGQTDSAKCQGLFGFVYTSGTVRNVILADTRIRGYTGTGGIVGVNSGTIEDCRVQGNVLVKSSGIGTNTVTSDDGSDFGGIAGSNNGGTVTRCTSSVTIDGYLGFYIYNGTNNTINNYSNNLGGVVGNNSGTVSNCLALNAVVTGDKYAAAIVGNNGGTLTANHYRSCTVTNDNHSNGSSIGVGVGTNYGSEDQDGARSVHTLTLGTDITATGESVVIDGITYYASNTTVTLGYDNLPAGQMPVYSVGGTTLEDNIFTMPAADRTVTVTLVNAWSGSGTQGDPYVITTTAQLDALASAVKGGTTYSGTYFVLGNDIAYSTEGLGDTDENFIPIGGYFDGSDKNFSGTFNGQNHTISGIRLYKNGTAAPSMNQGLFGRLDGATIENIVLADARITGYRYVGGLVGNKVNGTVQNCLVLESTITCADKYVGALFGKNTGTIAANYYHNCTVNGTNNATNVGVGGNGGTSSSSDKNGARSAHILTLGENVTATGESVTYQGTTWYASTTTVTLGYNNLLEGCVATYSLDGNILTGNTFTMPAADATVNGSFVSHWHADADHDGTTEERAYIITTTAGLDLLATKVNGGTDYYHKFFKLGADIAYDGTENNYTAIGNSSKYFIGTFDGDGYAVSGIHINTSGNYQGLFGYVGYTGTVKNVTLRSSTITGMNYVGGIVGYLYRGTVTDCRVESTVTIGTYDNGSNSHGGIVGHMNYTTVNGCISAATVTNNGKSGCYYYGGIVGRLSDGTVSNNLALGATVSANNYKGAIVGYRSGSNNTLANNYYHGCIVGGATTNIGTNGGDVIEDDGAVQVFSLTLGEGITATPAPAVTCDGINYYTTGTEITLNANAGYAITSATLTYGGNDYPIVGNSFEMPAQDVAVTAVLQVRYTFDSTTGALALLFGEFNKDNKWGNDVDPSAVTSVTATDEVSFTGDCSELFSNFTNCTSMDLGNVNTDALNNTFRMFDKCLSLLSLEGISDWDVSNVTNMIAMFRDCWSLSSLDLSDWNTANVTNMSSMFAGSGSLTTIYVGTGWNTESVTSTSYMFDDCSSLTTIDLSNWNTGNVTDMNSMFNYCSALQSLNISSWNTANVTIMKKMFYGCWNLQSLDLSGWNTANVTDMSVMFYSCSGLQSLDLTGWNTANVTNMIGMFEGCSGLQSLDLSGWNTAKVTDMSYMFYSCWGLQSLNISGWNTSNVSDMSGMFLNCTNLATIYVGEGWNTIHVVIQHSSNMFTNCTSLVGGMGTTYVAYYIDAEYARIDRGPNSDQPGYFTGRFNKDIAGYGDSDGGYYLIASPIGTVGPENVADMLANDYDLYRFNQSAALEWENWKDQNDGGYELVSGKGYLYANSEDVTLSFTGTPIEGDTYDVTLDKSADAEFAGWNLVGNPFADTAYLQGDGAFYTMNEAGTELEANTSLTSIAPMEGVFVFAEEDGETLTFTTEEPSKNGKGLVLNISHTQTSGVSAPELVPEPVEGREGAGVSTLRQAQGSTTAIIDRAIVRFDEGGVLPKFQMRSSSTKVYFPMDGKEYAVVNVGRDGVHTVSTIDVNFKAEHNGTYTLAFSTEGVTFRYLHLIDNMTGVDIDLLSAGDCGSSPTMTVSDVNPTNPNPEGVIAGSDPQSLTPSYTFEAKTTDGANRFRLEFSICGDTNGDNGPSTGSGTFAFIDASGNIIITADMDNATLQVIDAMGRVIVSRDVSGNVSTNGMTPGVYVLRLMNGDDVKTQKIVIQ